MVAQPSEVKSLACLGLFVMPLLAACARGNIGDGRGVDGGVTSDSDQTSPSSLGDAGTRANPCVGGDARVIAPSGRCFVLFASSAASWQDAHELCTLLHPRAHLAVIADAADDAAIQAMVGARDAWIGGSDRAVEGSWSWVNGERMAYTNWGLGEPNDGAGGEDCMLLRMLGAPTDPTFNVGTWDDRVCATRYPSVCELP